MPISIRELRQSDLIYMKYWGSTAESLPLTCGYVIVNNQDIPLLVSYLLPTPIGVCWFEALIANPLITKEDRRNYIKTMVQYLLDKARELGCERVVVTPTVDSVTRLLVETGFTLYPRKADYLWKDL